MTEKSGIYDPLRKKVLVRTPEEEVRQAVIEWLRDKRGVSENLMESEYPFLYNRRRYRADILVFDSSLKPCLLVECKAPDVKIDAKVMEQVVRYTRVLAVRYVLLSNGVTNHILRRKDDGGYEYLPEIPDDLGF